MTNLFALHFISEVRQLGNQEGFFELTLMFYISMNILMVMQKNEQNEVFIVMHIDICILRWLLTKLIEDKYDKMIVSLERA